MNSSKAAGDTWPTGVLGDLIVASGQTSQLPVGTYDFNSITVEPGGILQVISYGEPKWTILGIKGNLILKGQLIAKSFDGLADGIHQTAPDGTTLLQSDFQPQGGCGGINAESSPGGGNPRGGNPSINGNGGGGAAMGTNGGDADISKGGYGATAQTPFGGPHDFGPGGPCGSGPAANGENGTPAGGGWPPDGLQHCGGGGGGGAHGRKGGFLYFHINGNFDASGGTIDLSGEAGGAGGNGGDVGNGICGSGGGGGAGGNGGQLIIRFGGTFALPVFLINGGSGGLGGAGGKSHQWPSQHGVAGQNGQDGFAFPPDIAKIS